MRVARLVSLLGAFALCGSLQAIPSSTETRFPQFRLAVPDGKKRSILVRLAKLGPLPSDNVVTQAQLDEFKTLIDLIEHAPPDPDYIRPLLATFGPDDGFELYTHGVWALMPQDPQLVLAASLEAIENGREGSRRWGLETIARLRGHQKIGLPSDRELRLLEISLQDSENVALEAVYVAYRIKNEQGQRLLELAARASIERIRLVAAKLLAK
jgi:hypothetical protein